MIWQWRENHTTEIETFFRKWKPTKTVELKEFLAKLWKSFPKNYVPSAGQQELRVYLPDTNIVMEYWFRPQGCNWPDIILSYAILPKRVYQEWMFTFKYFEHMEYINQTMVSAQLNNIIALNLLGMWCLTYRLPRIQNGLVEIANKHWEEPNLITRAMFITLLDKPTEVLDLFSQYKNHPISQHLLTNILGDTDSPEPEPKEKYSPLLMISVEGSSHLSRLGHPYVFPYPENKNIGIADELEKRGSRILAASYRGDVEIKMVHSKSTIKKIDAMISDNIRNRPNIEIAYGNTIINLRQYTFDQWIYIGCFAVMIIAVLAQYLRV